MSLCAIALALVAGAVSVALVLGAPARQSSNPLPTCDDIGNHNRNVPDPVWSGPFRAAYERAGGRAELGCPRNDPSNGYVHPWGPGTSEDLAGGKTGITRIMALSPTNVIVMAAVYWHDYTDPLGPEAAPEMGYPTSEPSPCGSARLVLLLGGRKSPGAMVTDASTGHFVWLSSPIWTKYERVGGPLSRLGRPLGSLQDVPAGNLQRFEHGYIKLVDGVARTDREEAGGQEPASITDLAACLNKIPLPSVSPSG